MASYICIIFYLIGNRVLWWINPSKSKCLLLYYYQGESAFNLGIIFNGQLRCSNHINVIVGKAYGLLRNLWAVIDSTPFAIHMQLAKTFLIPLLLYGSEIFTNYDTDDRRKLNLAYNNIVRNVFIKRCWDIYHNFLTGYLELILIIY